ncbi:MAG: hypothetical protein IJI10_11310 [Eubacterium sp.]|nr:hypothetical protein [Eubacterium sp.]
MSTDTAKKTSFNWKNYTSMIGLVGLIILSIILSRTFLMPVNIMNILKQVAVPALLAVGMTFVIISGGIDLSVGSFVALSGVLFAMLGLKIGYIPSAIVMVLGGCLVGFIYGLLITKLNVPPFIATLAGQTIAKGAALVITRSAAVAIPNAGVNALGSGNFPAIPVLVILVAGFAYLAYSMIRTEKQHYGKVSGGTVGKIAAFVLIIIYLAYLMFQTKGLSYIVTISVLLVVFFTIVLNRSIFGRNVYAIGGNVNSARLAGVNVTNNIIGIYVMCSGLACFGGVLTAARLGAGTPQVGTNWELDAIAAVVIGGTSMAGGAGKLTGTVVGVLLMGVLNNLLSLMNVAAEAQMIFKGLIILAAVVIDATTSKKK